MEYTTYASRLRFLDACDVDDDVVDYDGLPVQGPDAGKIGKVEGFIVDALAGRAYYVVVDSGGWFSSRRFLLPIGHVTLDQARSALQVDVAKDSLQRYPEFDPDRFRQFSDEDLQTFEARMLEACCPGELLEAGAGRSAYDTRRHYTQPSWWTGAVRAKEHLRTVDTSPDRATPADPVPQQRHDPELMIGQADGYGERDARLDGQFRDGDGAAGPGEDLDSARPPAGAPTAERAQPGDVLGLESVDERSYSGGTAAYENRRKRAAARARDEEEQRPRQSER